MAERNGHKQERALVVGQPLSVFQYDPDIQGLDTAEVGVKQVIAYGITAVLQDRSFADLIGLLPEPGGDEQPWEYADRAQAHLLKVVSEEDRRKIRAAIIDLGMDRADTSQHLLSVGRRLPAWRVYAGETLGGAWTDSPSGAESFDEWLLNVSRNASKSERSRIRIACRTLAWLIDSDYKQVPDNPEEVFLPGNWRKWSTALAAIWNRKLTLDNVGDEAIEERLQEEIESFLAQASDVETTTADMEKFVKEHGESQAPAIVVNEKARDPDTGLYSATVVYDETQRAILRRDRRFDLRLEGEEYKKPTRTVQYRQEHAFVCQQCGLVVHENRDDCPGCGGSLEKRPEWASCAWLGDKWSDWNTLDGEPAMNGHLVYRLLDDSLGLGFWQYREQLDGSQIIQSRILTIDSWHVRM